MTEVLNSDLTHKTNLSNLNIGILIKQVPIPKEMRTGADGFVIGRSDDVDGPEVISKLSS